MRNFLLLLLALNLVSCGSDSKPNSEEITASRPSENQIYPGTQRMVDTLDAIFNRTDFTNHPYESVERLKLMEGELQEKIARGEKSDKLNEYIAVLLEAGRTESAIVLLEKLIQSNPSFSEVNEQSISVWKRLAISYLRMGEQLNCIGNPHPDVCIFPISEDAVYAQQQAVRTAISHYKKVLAFDPNDYGTRWLLNLCYQTIGEYPEKVPSEYLLDPKFIESPVEFERFVNIAHEVGFSDLQLAGGSISEDFDNDGDLDIIASSWGMRHQIRYFENKGDSGFVDRTEDAGLMGLTGGLNLIQADYNNDGNIDFFVLRGAWRPKKEYGTYPNSLIKNLGNGKFADVTFEAGVYSVSPTQTGTWLDVNLDGNIDLFVGNENNPDGDRNYSELYINQGDGSFVESAFNYGVGTIRNIKGVISGDINNDGYPDLFVSVQGGVNSLYLNLGGTRFKDIAKEAGVTTPFFAFPCWFFDVNQDGWEDLLVFAYDYFGSIDQGGEVFKSYIKRPFNSDITALYINLKDNKFVDQALQYNLNVPLHAMGSNFGDLDNDGYFDFYVGTGAPDYTAVVPNRMFKNEKGRKYLDITTAGGFGHIQKGHAVAFADFDRDGDQDVFANMGGAIAGDIFQNALYENPGNDNTWIVVQLEGTKSNRAAIGARLRVTTQQEDGNERIFYVTCNSGGSFGASSLQQEMGLAKARRITNLEVNWPNGENKYISYGAFAPKQKIKLVEGEADPELVPYQKINLR